MTQQITRSDAYHLESTILVAVTIAEKGEFTSKKALLKMLHGSVSDYELDDILDYFNDSGMIVIDKTGGITWIFSTNEKLAHMHKTSVNLL